MRIYIGTPEFDEEVLLVECGRIVIFDEYELVFGFCAKFCG
jgi:hypothetical protein